MIRLWSLIFSTCMSIIPPSIDSNKNIFGFSYKLNKIFMSNLKLPSLREITRKHFDNQDVIDLVSSEDSNSLWVKSCQKDDQCMVKISFENNGEDSSYDFDTMAERNKQNHLNHVIANLQQEVYDTNIGLF